MRIRTTLAVLLVTVTSILGVFGALKGARVTVTAAADAPKIRTNTGLSYESFGEAAAFWDVEAAGRLATREDQRSYLEATRALMQGKEEEAETTLHAVLASSKDATLRGLSTSLLEQLYFADGRWEKYRALEGPGAPDNPFRVMVEALGVNAAPASENHDRVERPDGVGSPDGAEGPAGAESKVPEHRLTIPAEPTVVPTTPDAGLPTLRVSVNGKPFDFILDTGAPFTVINADVAAQSGVVPVGLRECVIRNDVRGRPARIERLEIGGVSVQNHPVVVVPVEGLTIPERPSENKTIQGILGWPLIRRLDLEIDLAGGRTTIRRPAPRPVEERNLFFFFRPIVVARDVKGIPLHLLLDTGTDGTTLFQRIGKKTALGKVKRINLGTSRIGETTRDDEGSMLPKFEFYLGDHRVVFEKIPLLPGSNLDGILGTDVHTGGRVRIDYLNGTYTLEP